jgi:NADH:ubiquinone oxidoreductase subunit 5 (subunit L)/multisubunit Na+/H+ antiporter MnhA subunit
MEGPTPSSAIFYGSLSIHFGVFLLLRTIHFWEQQFIARILIGAVGLTTAILGYLIAKAQPTIKTQIAYASVSQIGLMFVEIALGLQTLALVHFVGNAFLRTYQLLVSPSVVSYMIREQFYNFRPHKENPKYIFGKGFHYSLYLLSLREFNMDYFMTKFVFTPFKKVGKRLNFLTYQNVFFYFLPTYCLGWGLYWAVYFGEKYFSQEAIAWLHFLMPDICALIAILMIMKAFSEHEFPILAWLLVVLGHFWIALAVAFNEKFGIDELVWYLGGVGVAGSLGWIVLEYLRRREPKLFDLYRYYGHSYEYTKLGGFFLLCTLGLMGFPITTTFIGEDLVFSHVHAHQFFLAFLLSSCFVFGGIALIRIYARLFLGNHAKVYHETPLQSS